MKKTNAKPENKHLRDGKLAVRTERVRDLQSKDLENVGGGLWDVHSLHSSCC